MESKEKKVILDDFNNAKDLIKMEKDRIIDQEILIKEDIKKSEYNCQITQNSIEKVKNKVYKIQSFNRDLAQE